ncbi:MAG: NAD(P)-dependent oxidoreductase [Armatimonadota bacterium]|nr:NAD(P)-dependent oxidoreductase [Armatimonadota bacterium]MDR7534480.1 NAD(P)-dependent oxidoreductase [Armatimonadota bacterium]MDR7535789.1 NAD(P)-dependent oxidoreductase [Armatimonadota bacterium]
MAKVAFFGAGIMGEPMAGHLLEAGHEVVVMAHRNRAPIERLIARGAVEARTPQEAGWRTDTAIMMLPTAREVEEIVFGADGLAAALGSGYTIVDMSTSYPPDTRRIAERVVAAGGRFLDAPVTGGPAGARNRTLTIMVGGDPETLEAARPLLEAMGQHVHHFGPVGAGHTAKLIQNMISIVASAGIAEGFALAAAAGLDVAQFFAMLSTSTANSPTLQYVVPRILNRDFERVGFRLDMAFKDIKQATALARELTVPLLAANGAAELMQLARAQGFGHLDSSALIRGLEAVLGIEVRPK